MESIVAQSPYIEITMIEHFNPRKGEAILKYWSHIAPQLYPNGIPKDGGESVRDYLRVYMDESTHGKKVVKYTQSTDFARFHTRCGLQGLKRVIRNTISGDLYIDLDFKNAQPTLLLQFCAKLGIDTPYLRQYIDNREDILQSTGTDRATAKKFFLSIMMNAPLPKGVRDPFVISFYEEMKEVREYMFAEYSEHFTNISETNPTASVLSKILAVLENACLQSLVDFLLMNSIHPAALIFDGLLVDKYANIDLAFIEEACEHIYAQTGYNVEICKSDMGERLDLDRYIKPVCERCGYDHAEIESVIIALKPKLKALSLQREMASVFKHKLHPDCFAELLLAMQKQATLSIENVSSLPSLGWAIILPRIPRNSKIPAMITAIEFVNYNASLERGSRVVRRLAEMPTQVGGQGIQIDLDQAYTFADFADQCRTRVYDKIEHVVPDLCKVFFPIVHPGNTFLVKESATGDSSRNCKVGLQSKIPFIIVAWVNPDAGRPGEPPVLYKPLYQIIKYSDVHNELTPIERIVFQPNPRYVKNREYNMFHGLPVLTIEPDPAYQSDLDIILLHIRDTICSGDADLYEYVLTWFAQSFYTPWEKTQIVLLFFGEQGVGKSILPDLLINKHIYGEYAITMDGIGKLVQRFNSAIQDKLCIVCNEVSSADGTWHSNFERLKSLITDPYMCIEKKGIDVVEDYPNYSNFIFTTNNSDSVKLGKGDRRYCCIQVSDHRKGDFDYFEQLAKACNKHAARLFYDHCKQYIGRRNLKRIPMTTLKQDMLSLSYNSVERFIEEIKRSIREGIIMETPENNHHSLSSGGESVIDVLRRHAESDDDHSAYTEQWKLRICASLRKGKIKSADLYTAYKEFCELENEKIKSNNWFGIEVSKVFMPHRGTQGVRQYILIP